MIISELQATPLRRCLRRGASSAIPFLSASVLLGAVAAAQAPSSSAVTAQWGCDAPAARTCYFSVISATGAVRSFSLPSGRRMDVSGVVPGRDQYVVSLDTPNLGDLNHCRQMMSLGHLCQRKIVDFGYND